MSNEPCSDAVIFAEWRTTDMDTSKMSDEACSDDGDDSRAPHTRTRHTRIWSKHKTQYAQFLRTHGHLDVPFRTPGGIGRHMSAMRSSGRFRVEFESEFPGEFWASHRERMWTREYEPRYRAYLAKYGHLDVPHRQDVIGPHMNSMRRQGSFRSEFESAFPGTFWPSHRERVWACEYEPRYRAYLAKHGHLDVACNVTVIGTHMNSMRRVGCFRAEFDAAFPGEFWASRRERMWAREYEPRYRAYLAKHGHLDVPHRERLIGPHMRTMRAREGAHLRAFNAAFPGQYWSSHNARKWAVEYEPLYRAYLAQHGHLNVPLDVPVIGPLTRTRLHGSADDRFQTEFQAAFPSSGSREV